MRQKEKIRNMYETKEEHRERREWFRVEVKRDD